LRHVPTFPLWDRAGGVDGRRQAAWRTGSALVLAPRPDAVVFAPPGGARRKATGRLAVLLLRCPGGPAVRLAATFEHLALCGLRSSLPDIDLPYKGRRHVFENRRLSSTRCHATRLGHLEGANLGICLFDVLVFFVDQEAIGEFVFVFCRSCASVSTGRRSPRNGYGPFNQIRRREG
jgi:hypothetical protein